MGSEVLILYLFQPTHIEMTLERTDSKICFDMQKVCRGSNIDSRDKFHEVLARNEGTMAISSFQENCPCPKYVISIFLFIYHDSLLVWSFFATHYSF